MTQRNGPPFFVGGTGRSGTTILGRLIGAHSTVSLVPIETRFLVDGRGLLDLVKDPGHYPDFRERITGDWWERPSPYGDTRGLHLMITEERFRSALNDLEQGLEEGSVLDAARNFANSILDSQLDGAETWVEMTPTTVGRGKDLVGLYPDAKIIHIHRDGRDVACSVAKTLWGPEDPFEGLQWWAAALRRASRGSAGLDRSRLLHVDLEDVVGPARELVMERILDFLGLDPDPEMERFLDAEVTGTHAHVEQWMKDIDPERIEEFRERHRELVTELGRDGIAMGSS